MIALERKNGRPLRIGHRGAAALAPENTLRSFGAAIEAGVDLIEFDVIEAAHGGLVVAHGRADVGPETPTLDEALQFFVGEAPGIGLHLDLKLTRHEQDVVAAIRRFDLSGRSFVSSYYLGTARAVASVGGGVRVGFTVPRRIFRISDQGSSAPIGRLALQALRCLTPPLVRPLLAVTRANDVVLHHSLVTTSSVQAAHARGAAVVTWTVDDPAILARVDEAGVDAVVTNDPLIFTSTLET
jgi:glycerophosphoryl diester phosphodiesterase